MTKNWFEGRLPDDWFSPPGIVTVSHAAMALAKAFEAEARKNHPHETWIVAFDWADSRRVRDRGTNNWRDLGAGLDLAAYESWKVPAKNIHETEGFRFAVKIPGQILEASPEKLIDADATAVSGLVLR
jgi:hypothetical protein